MKIRLSREAQQQVLKEKRYLAAHSRWASIDFTAKMQRAVQLIGTYPDVGTATGAVEHVRKFVLSPYHLHYVVRKTGIVIISVWNGRQLRQDLESDRDPGD